jgi:RHS repeat-associated protein
MKSSARLFCVLSASLLASLLGLSSPVISQICVKPPESVPKSFVENFTQVDKTDTGSNDGADGGEAEQCMASVAGDATGDSTLMMRASVQTLIVSLALSDKPIDYRPAKGPQVPQSFYYSQRESYQPRTYHYANLGPKWSFSGISYVIDDPARPGEGVQRYKAGGGTRIFRKADFNSGTGRFAPDGRDASVLVRLADPVRYERRLPNGGVETYAHSDGKKEYPRRFFLTERKDPAGNRIVFHYDAQNRLTDIEDATGKKTVLEYGHTDPLKITGIVAPDDRRAKIAYDNMGRLISITDAIGLTSQVTYSGNGTFVDSLTTPYGVTRFASGRGWVDRWIEITDPLGRTERVEARDDAKGIADSEAIAPQAPGLVNKGLSKHNTFYWDAATYAKYKGDYTKAKILHWKNEGNMAVGVISSVKEPLENRQWFLYDPKVKTSGACVRPVSIARALPENETQAIRYGWNAQGNPTMSVDPVGRETRFDYAPNGIDVTALRQKNGAGWDTLARVTWNDSHRPLKIQDAAGRTAQYTWNAAGQLTSRTDALGRETKYEYDAAGRLQKIYNAAGRIERAYTYDHYGNLASETDANGYSLKHEHDAFNRRTKTTYPDGTTNEYTWDRLDLVMVKDRNGKRTRYQYDAARQLVAAQDAVRTVKLSYDRAGRMIGLTDGRGNHTRWSRDLQGRIVAKYMPDESKILYGFDDAGRQITRIDPLGQTRQFAYGKDNRVIAVSYLNAHTPTAPIRFKWDAAYPRLKAMEDETGTTTYAYGRVGTAGAMKLIEEAVPNEAALRLVYDPAGRLQSWKLGDVGETLAYDDLGRIAKNKNPLGEFDYGYEGDSGQIVSAAIAATPLQWRYGYEPNSGDKRLKSIQSPAGARDFTYKTAPENLIAELTERAGDQLKTWKYHYDALDRLEVAQTNGHTYRYNLDEADNLIGIDTPAGPSYYTAGRDNRIAQAPYKWDKNGNRIEDESKTYQWDAENRLVAIGYKQDPSRRTEFRYDGLGRRIAIIETNATETTETRYRWCGSVVCQSKTKQTQAYYYAAGSYRPGKGKSYYSRDHLGSVRDVLTDAGKIKERYDYDPYGQIEHKTSEPEFGYAGMQYHAASGLYLTKYRVYEPKTGRWLSRDPIQEKGGINLYSYVGGNPVTFIDPLGLARVCRRPLRPSDDEALPTMIGDGEWDLGVFHEHIFYDDGSNVGYGQHGIFVEERQDIIDTYECQPEHYDDDKMHLAVYLVTAPGYYTAENYFITGNKVFVSKRNCQNFVTDVLEEYQLLTGPNFNIQGDQLIP